jgi:hypothetical protein
MKINREAIKKIGVLKEGDLLAKLLDNYIKNGKRKNNKTK